MDKKKRFGAYEVIEEISRGGMSIVYKANHPTLSKLVAIKVLSQYLSNDSSFIERFRNEAQILSSFRHQNIVYIIDFAQENDLSYLVMDYIDGYTIKQMLNQTGLFSLKIATNIIKGVANALSYTHRKGIIHRDIKSSNIMIDGNGRVLVTDFGLSKEMSFSSLEEVSTDFAGTLGYISPEQLDNKIGKTDERTDIYSLGIVFYEIVTGRLPFSEENTPANLAYQHLSVVPDLPSRHKTDLLPKANAVIMKMLEKDPGKRYQSADELLRDMNEMDDILQYYRSSDENREGSYFEVVSDGTLPPEESLPTQEEITLKAPPEENDAFIGKIIDHHYKVEKLVLKRILSSLYLGKDVIEDVPVTIQIPNETRSTFKARIEREIQTLKNVNYRGFVKFIDVVEEQGTCYVIREYVPGTTVKNFLRKQKLSINQCIEIILEVLDSLQYLHEHGIIHRDLNSDVVIIANKGPAKITSLGFTRVEDASSVSSGEFLGVVQYTAPEQITQSKSDSKSDIYSVGILLFEMLTGAPPFDSPLPVEVMDMHLKKMPRFPEDSQKEIPLNLQRIVLKALSKSPDQRFQSAKEMSLELKNFIKAYEQGDTKVFDIHTSTGEDASTLIYKNLPEASSIKTDGLSFSLKKKQDNQKEQKKVDVNKMMNEGLRDIKETKIPQKEEPKQEKKLGAKLDPKIEIKPIPKVEIKPEKMMEQNIAPKINISLKPDPKIEIKPDIKPDNKPVTKETKEIKPKETNFSAELNKKTKEKEEPPKITPTTVLPVQKEFKNEAGGGYKTLLYIVLGFLLIGSLFTIWLYNKDKIIKKPPSTVSIEITSPKAPYVFNSFTPYNIKITYPKDKNISKLKFASFASEVQGSILSMKDGAAEIQIYSSVTRNNFKFPFDIVAYNSKGTEIARNTFMGLLKNENMVEVIIKPDEKKVEKRDVREVTPNTMMIAPLVYQYNLYIPIRQIIPLFNGKMTYDFEQEMITITNMDSHTYKLYIFQSKYFIDNQLYEGENPIYETGDVGYLPVYFLTDKMGFIMRMETGSDNKMQIHMIRTK